MWSAFKNEMSLSLFSKNKEIVFVSMREARAAYQTGRLCCVVFCSFCLLFVCCV